VLAIVEEVLDEIEVWRRELETTREFQQARMGSTREDWARDVLRLGPAAPHFVHWEHQRGHSPRHSAACGRGFLLGWV
jgi:hypothetical protein